MTSLSKNSREKFLILHCESDAQVQRHCKVLEELHGVLRPFIYLFGAIKVFVAALQSILGNNLALSLSTSLVVSSIDES